MKGAERGLACFRLARLRPVYIAARGKIRPCNIYMTIPRIMLRRVTRGFQQAIVRAIITFLPGRGRAEPDWRGNDRLGPETPLLP